MNDYSLIRLENKKIFLTSEKLNNISRMIRLDDRTIKHPKTEEDHWEIMIAAAYDEKYVWLCPETGSPGFLSRFINRTIGYMILDKNINSRELRIIYEEVIHSEVLKEFIDVPRNFIDNSFLNKMCRQYERVVSYLPFGDHQLFMYILSPKH